MRSPVQSSPFLLRCSCSQQTDTQNSAYSKGKTKTNLGSPQKSALLPRMCLWTTARRVHEAADVVATFRTSSLMIASRLLHLHVRRFMIYTGKCLLWKYNLHSWTATCSTRHKQRDGRTDGAEHLTVDRTVFKVTL